MSKLEIVLPIVEGLQDNNKRKKIFQTFQNLKYKVILDGDINVVEKLTMDRKSGNPNRQHHYRLEELKECVQN